MKINFKSFDTTLGIEYSYYAKSRLDKDYWIVKKGFVYYLGDEYNSYVTVPRGYLTDGASVPRVFWNIIPPWGDYGQACVLHDYLCQYPYIYKGTEKIELTRHQVNKILLDSMKLLGVGVFKRNLMYYAVEAYRLVWKDFAKQDTKKEQVEKELLDHYEKHEEWL